MIKIVFIAVLITLAFSEQCSAAEKSAQICTMEYSPYCGTDSAGKRATYGNRCVACSNSQVVTIQQGECLETVQRLSMNLTKCITRSLACTKEYNPTCGITSTGKEIVFSNPCTACADPQIESTYEGTCQKASLIEENTSEKSSITICKEPRPEVCTLEYTKVCGVLKECPNGNQCYKADLGNPCSACGDKSVKGYIMGDCPTLSIPGQVSLSIILGTSLILSMII